MTDLFDSRDATHAVDEARRDVRYFSTDVPVETIVSRFREEQEEEGDIYIPDYQRNMKWSSEKKSYFVESCILRIPVPPVFFYEVQGRLEVVDGSQRIRTLVEFLHGYFALEGLEKLDVLNGCNFKDLPPAISKRLLNTSIRAFILEEGVDPTTRVEMFRRINTSSKPLTEAEIRKGAYRGPFLDLVLDCSERKTFKDLMPVPKSQKRGKTGFSDPKKDQASERQELVARFFVYLEHYHEFVHDVAKFIDKRFILFNRQMGTDVHLAQSKSWEFDRAIDFIAREMPRAFFRDNANQVPRVRFEAISVGTALALRTSPDLTDVDTAWLGSDDFAKLVRTDASNSGPKLKARIEFVRDRLLGR